VPDDLLYLVAEGPLDTFVANHGATFIDRIEAELRSSDGFRGCLGVNGRAVELGFEFVPLASNGGLWHHSRTNAEETD
jgi:hypothetical protein